MLFREVKQGQLAPQVRPALSGRLDPRVLLARLVLSGRLGPQGLQASKDHRGHKDLKGRRANRVKLVRRDPSVPQAQLVRRAQPGLPPQSELEP